MHDHQRALRPLFPSTQHSGDFLPDRQLRIMKLLYNFMHREFRRFFEVFEAGKTSWQATLNTLVVSTDLASRLDWLRRIFSECDEIRNLTLKRVQQNKACFLFRGMTRVDDKPRKWVWVFPMTPQRALHAPYLSFQQCAQLTFSVQNRDVDFRQIIKLSLPQIHVSC
jgi:hypothetical protein